MSLVPCFSKNLRHLDSKKGQMQYTCQIQKASDSATDRFLMLLKEIGTSDPAKAASIQEGGRLWTQFTVKGMPKALSAEENSSCMQMLALRMQAVQDVSEVGSQMRAHNSRRYEDLIQQAINTYLRPSFAEFSQETQTEGAVQEFSFKLSVYFAAYIRSNGNAFAAMQTMQALQKSRPGKTIAQSLAVVAMQREACVDSEAPLSPRSLEKKVRELGATHARLELADELAREALLEETKQKQYAERQAASAATAATAQPSEAPLAVERLKKVVPPSSPEKGLMPCASRAVSAREWAQDSAVQHVVGASPGKTHSRQVPEKEREIGKILELLSQSLMPVFFYHHVARWGALRKAENVQGFSDRPASYQTMNREQLVKAIQAHFHPELDLIFRNPELVQIYFEKTAKAANRYDYKAQAKMDGDEGVLTVSVEYTGNYCQIYHAYFHANTSSGTDPQEAPPLISRKGKDGDMMSPEIDQKICKIQPSYAPGVPKGPALVCTIRHPKLVPETKWDLTIYTNYQK